MKAIVRSRRVVWAAFIMLGVVLASAQAFAAGIASIVGQVSQTQYTTYQLTVQEMGLGQYGGSAYNQGYRDRLGAAGPGSKGNQETRLYLSDQFTAMGLSVSVQGTYSNVIGELLGAKTPDKVYIVCGHYDHVAGSVSSARPGGDDNASGTAAVLEAARALSQYQFESTIRFIGFNCEEAGELGSKNYVNNVVKPNHQNIAGVINLDMILRPGWDSDPSHVKDLNLASTDTDWAATFVAAADDYVPSLLINSSFVEYGGSDHVPFEDAGFPALMAIENTAHEIWSHGSNAYYHGPKDASDLAAGALYDYPFATNVVRATVATMAEEAVLIPEPATLVLLAAGGAMMLLGRRRR